MEARDQEEKGLARWCREYQRWCSDHSAVELDVWVWFEQLRDEIANMADGGHLLAQFELKRFAA